MMKHLTILLLAVGLLAQAPAVNGQLITDYVDDYFDDGDLTINANGLGSGYVLMVEGTKSVLEMAGGPAVWETDGGDWNGVQLHSFDEVNFTGITTFSWEVGNVEITADNPDGPDCRIFLGVLPGTLALQGVDSGDLYWNTTGGLFLLMEFDSASPGTVNLQLYGVKYGKAPQTFPANNNGSKTLAWDWETEVIEVRLDLDDERVIVKRDGAAVISTTWSSLGITPGGAGGLFENGGWGFHYGSNYSTGRGGHELHRFSVFTTATESDCGNGLDDDGDALIDCDDPDCLGEAACIESDCDNGLDDDGDGDIDCADADCRPNAACIESDCQNGLDDDGDGDVDCNDEDCEADLACLEGDLLVLDPFDDGDLLHNVNGIGGGHVGVGWSKTWGETVGGPAWWGADGDNWAGQEIQHLDDIDFLALGGTTRFSWKIGHVVIPPEGDMEGRDYRIYCAVLSSRNSTRGTSQELYPHFGGSVQALIFIDAANPLSAGLELYAPDASKQPAEWPVWLGGASLNWDWANEATEISISLDLTGFSVLQDGILMASNVWSATNINLGPGGEFEDGVYGMHFGSNNDQGRGGHELYRFTVIHFEGESDCSNLLDDDGDFLVDCDDPDCRRDPSCQAEVFFTRGDGNADGELNIADAINALTYQFLGAPLNCVDASDVDDSGEVDVTDVINLLKYLFLEDLAPESPFPQCGPDESDDALPPCEYPPENCG